MSAVGRWNSVRGKNVGLNTGDFDSTLSVADKNVQLALDTLDDNTGGGGSLDTSNFDGILSGADTTIQAAMDTIDDMSSVKAALTVPTTLTIGTETLITDGQILYNNAGRFVIDSNGVTFKDESSATYDGLYVGKIAEQAGQINLFGHATGNSGGGLIWLYPAADFDTDIIAFSISVNEDDLRIGPNTGQDALQFTGAGAAVTAAFNVALSIGNGTQSVSIAHDATDLNMVMSTPSDLVIDCGTEKTIELVQTVWDDLVVPTANVKLGGANAASEQAYKGGLVASFASNADNYMYFTFQMPHDYKEGTNVEFHIHWTISDDGGEGAAENVKWDFTWSASSPALAPTFEQWPGESSATLTVDVANMDADDHIATEIVVMTGTNFKVSENIICSLKRDVGVASDYANEAYIVSLDVHYQKDTLGSRQEWVK